jgi:2,4-dienoyl-CoA reductase-like NADH-dependent reductase (Old Yellow Enzyme family)
MAEYYGSYARGGFALVITEGTYIDDREAQGYLNQPGIVTDAQVAAWKQVVDAIHAAGGAVFLQLQHAGAIAQGRPSGSQNVGPSVIVPKGEKLSIYQGTGGFDAPREITRDEIRQVVADFATAALRAREAGFDGVELHGANGYLLDQFFSASTNERTDEYGGDVRNRIRLDEECVRAVRDAVGPTWPVGIRLSQSKVNDFEYKWPGGVEDAKVVGRLIEAAGASFIHVTEHDILQPAFAPGGPTLAEAIKAVVGIPVIANGGLDKPEDAAGVVERGAADVVALGKPALANHDWPKKAQSGAAMEEFDFQMLLPLATLDYEAAWRATRS